MRDLTSRVLGVSLLLTLAGCDCSGGITNAEDAFRFRNDVGEDANGGGVDALTDANLNGIDTNLLPIDAFIPGGFDASIGMALDCVHTHSLGVDYFRLSRDGDAENPPATAVVSRSGELVGVYSSTDFVPGSGERHLEVFRRDASGAIVSPAIIPNTLGANLPAVVSSTDGYWIAYQQGGNVFVTRTNATLTTATPSMVGTGPITTAPQLVKTSAGGYVAWITGGRVHGRALDAMGAATGSNRTLEMGMRPVLHVALQRVGAADAVSVSWSDGTTRPSVAQVNVSAGTIGAAMPLAGDVGAFSSLDMAGQSMAVPGGIALDGAGVYDIQDGASRDVLFRVLTATGGATLPTATVGAGGDQAWAASVDAYLTGYLIAYRARLAGDTRTFLRVGYLDREGCRLGTVTDRFPLGQIESDRGATPQITSSGGDVLIVWSDAADSFNDYFAATMSCTERE